MTIDKITAYNNELHRRTEIRRAERRHTERIQDDRRIKHNREIDEAKRIEMNRRMNRPGQNLDKLA